MKATVGIYDTHQHAVEAIEKLGETGFDVKKISILGQAEIVDDHLHTVAKMGVKETGASVGAVLGTALGVLTGASIIAIPGLGFLFGAGALIGAFAGLDAGIIGGGLVAILIEKGMKKEVAVLYHEHIKEGKFLVFVEGDVSEIERAQSFFKGHGAMVEEHI